MNLFEYLEKNPLVSIAAGGLLLALAIVGVVLLITMTKLRMFFPFFFMAPFIAVSLIFIIKGIAFQVQKHKSSKQSLEQIPE